MSELILPCHIGINHQLERDPPSEPFVFQRVTQAGCPTPPSPLSYRIEEVTEIYEGDYTTVYRASLLGHQPAGPRNIVLKTDVNARYPRSSIFTQEALRYEKDLQRLQGTYIPRCYGLFQATIYNKLVSVLLLEDCGESVDFRDESLSCDDKIEIYHLFTELHGHGFAHHDVDGRNVVKNQDGRFILIDLEHSGPHKCEVRLQVLMGDFAPPDLEFGCQELYDLAMELDFWLPDPLNFYGHHVPVWAFKKGRAEDLVALIPDCMLRTEEDRQRVWKHAEAMISDVSAIQAEYADVPDEKRYARPAKVPESRSSSDLQQPPE
ncbi:hypothetical protein FPV67DRAFT_1674240 [Lyophyllum atratum]|nr:hypothetical protein FPV67DRAFT_1674240 [Lyophyllum atratum]